MKNETVQVERELLPCPCGARVDTDECPYPHNRERTLWAIACLNPECGWICVGKSPEDVAHVWNERAALSPSEPKDEQADFDDFQRCFSEWAFATFKGQTVEAKLRHAIKEIGEIIDAPEDINEWGDLFMLFCNAAKKQGFTLSQILAASVEKWQTDLIHREWQEPDADGCVHRVKPADEQADAGQQHAEPVAKPFAYIIHDAEIGPEPGDEIVGEVEADEYDSACVTPVYLHPPAPSQDAPRHVTDAEDTALHGALKNSLAFEDDAQDAVPVVLPAAKRYRTKVIYRNPTDGEVKESEIDVVDAMDHERAIASLNAQWIARINVLALMKLLQDREQRWDEILEPEEIGEPCPDYVEVSVTVGDLRELRKLTEVKS